MSQQKRQYFRIEYPVIERPTLTMGADKFEVVDASERGLRIIGKEGKPSPTDIKGNLKFKSGSECPVVGKVTRKFEDGSLAVQLTVGISLSIIMNEQRLLIQKYRAS